MCACFTIRLKLYLYISWNTYKKLKKCLFFRGESSGVKIHLALGIYIRFCCTSCKQRWLKMRYFNTCHLNLYYFFRFNHHYKLMHSIKWMVQKLDLYWFEYFLFRIITRFWLLFWRSCKLSSCINPVLDPYSFIKGIKKTQSLSYFYQMNCDII